MFTSEKFANAIDFFVYVYIELTILFLLISFIVELMNNYVNPKKIRTLLSSKKRGYLTASLLGLISPFCSCSTIPFTIGLLKAKTSFGPVMTFLFTSPVLSPMMITLFLISFGWKITLMYSCIALITSLIAGYILEKYNFDRFVKNYVIFDSCFKENTKTSDNSYNYNKLYKISISNIGDLQQRKSYNIKKMLEIARKTFKQYISFIPFIIIGISIGAFLHGFVPTDIISEYANKDNIFAVPLSAILGIPLYMNTAVMIGVAPELLNSGVSMGAVMALTIGATGASIPEVILLKRIFKWQLILFFLLNVFLMAIVCGYLINIIF